MKVISIVAATAADSACHDDSGEVPRLHLPLTRRELLRGFGRADGHPRRRQRARRCWRHRALGGGTEDAERQGEGRKR